MASAPVMPIETERELPRCALRHGRRSVTAATPGDANPDLQSAGPSHRRSPHTALASQAIRDAPPMRMK